MERFFAAFNKLGRRERIGILFALLALVYFVMDVALVGPAQKRQKAAKTELAKVEGEVAALRNELVIVKAQLERDPFAKDRAQLDQYKRVMEEASAFLAKVESDPRQVGAILRELIGSTPGVTLVALKTLPVVAITDSKTAGTSKAGAPASGTAGGGAKNIYRRGIEVTIRGNYLAMLPYLEKLQGMKTRVLWAEADLDVATYPDSTLKLTIYTLSAQPEASLG
jgi:MSHA biogenesis protein MshJ